MPNPYAADHLPQSEAQRQAELANFLSSISLQENVLLNALLAYCNGADPDVAAQKPIAYRHLGQDRVHKLEKITIPTLEKIVKTYQNDPKDLLSLLRWTLIYIGRDTAKPNPLERKARLERYLKAALSLHVKLDFLAFRPDDKLQQGVPEYLPDGLSDMGGEAQINPALRDREKIRVNKKLTFSRAVDTLKNILWNIAQTDQPPNSNQVKEYIVQYIAAKTHESMPYDYNYRAPIIGAMLGRSINLDDVEQHDIAVCRHHALETQVLLQAMGITSQLFKCMVRFGDKPPGGHAANLVRMNSKWYVLDTTNPEVVGVIPKVYLRELPGVTENPYKQLSNPTWIFDTGDKRRQYTLRKSMHFRIRNNHTV